jgi:hypothetical protein
MEEEEGAGDYAELSGRWPPVIHELMDVCGCHTGGAKRHTAGRSRILTHPCTTVYNTIKYYNIYL